MKQALSAWVDQEEKRSRLTRDALVDVDEGSVIDHQSVQAWAESLGTDTPLPVPVKFINKFANGLKSLNHVKCEEFWWGTTKCAMRFKSAIFTYCGFGIRVKIVELS